MSNSDKDTIIIKGKGATNATSTKVQLLNSTHTVLGTLEIKDDGSDAVFTTLCGLAVHMPDLNLYKAKT